MTILLADPRVSDVSVCDNGEPLVALDPVLTGGRPGILVRSGVAARLSIAALSLPDGLRLRVEEGHRSPVRQRELIASYAADVRLSHPHASAQDREVLVSRFVAPLEVAPHVAGGAVDLTLVDADGRPLDMGTPIDATPEASDGACYTGAQNISAEAKLARQTLRAAMRTAGLINYPTEWWHWSYGDRYWALLMEAPHALYGPIAAEDGRR
jgi:D-alanyl-D-alanine dipeptidase